MPCSSALSWSSLPLRATALAITRTSAIVFFILSRVKIAQDSGWKRNSPVAGSSSFTKERGSSVKNNSSVGQTVALYKVTAPRGAVGQTNHTVSMDYGLSID